MGLPRSYSQHNVQQFSLAVLLITIEFLSCCAEGDDLAQACANVTPVHTTRELGTITSSNGYPQPENTTGCRMWYIQGHPMQRITLSFDDLDLVTSDPDSCTGGSIILGPDPNKTLCGTLRHMNLTERTYQPHREHMWIKYLHKQDQVGRGFKFTYVIGPENSTYCPNSYFKCASGACILLKWVCNGAFECRDGSDEKNCSAADVIPPTIAPFDCGDGFFRCEDVPHQEMRCFPESFLCDGKPDCNDGRDEKHCDTGCQHYKEGPTGTISSPEYPVDHLTNIDCKWIIHVKTGSKIQIRFFDFDMQQSEYVEIRDGSYDGNLLDRLDWKNPPTKLVESLSNTVAVLFHSESTESPGGFNATFQEKGVCLAFQQPCGYGENDCYDKTTERCDGTWHCPMHGGDERGCGFCGYDRFSCGSGKKCYRESEHCNGILHCTNKADEKGCSPTVCGPHNGTFLCHNQMCIYESWHCDGANDCGDNSDEISCPLSRKVVIAAVIGSLICALLLTIALGCTCQLHALRLREQYNRRRYRSPLTQLQEEIFSRRLAPPNYNEAMVSSRPFEDARREFLDQMQADMAANGEVDLPSLVTRVTAPPTDSNHNEPQTRILPTLAVSEIQRPLIVVCPHDVSGESDTSDDTMIDIPPVHTSGAVETTESSNVHVRVSLDTGITAQWTRARPKETEGQDTILGAANDESVQTEEASSDRSEDSDSAMLNLSSSSDTSSGMLDLNDGGKEACKHGSDHVLVTEHEISVVCDGVNDIPVSSQNDNSDHHSNQCDSNIPCDPILTSPEQDQSTTGIGCATETKVPDCDAEQTIIQLPIPNELSNPENRLSCHTVESIEMVATIDTMEPDNNIETMETSDTQPLIC